MNQECQKCLKEIEQGTPYLCIGITRESEKNRIITVDGADSLVIRCTTCGVDDIMDLLAPVLPPEDDDDFRKFHLN